jgi:hypothetical protein
MGDTLAGHGSMRFPSARGLAAWRAKTGRVLADAQQRLDRRADGELFALEVDEPAREVRFAVHVSSGALAAECGTAELRTLANMMWTGAVQKAEGEFAFVSLTGESKGLRLPLAEGRANQRPAQVAEDEVLAAVAPYLTTQRRVRAPGPKRARGTQKPLDVRYRASTRPQRVSVEIEVDYRRNRDVGASLLVEALCEIVAHGCGGSDAFLPKVGRARAPWGDEPPDELPELTDVNMELTLAGLAPSVLAAWVREVLWRFRVRRLSVRGADAPDRGPLSLTTARVQAIGREKMPLAFVRHASVKLRAVDVAKTSGDARKRGKHQPELVATIRARRGDLDAALEAMATALQLLAARPGTMFFPKRVKNGYELHGIGVPTRLDIAQAKAVLENGAARLGHAVEWHLGVRPPRARVG